MSTILRAVFCRTCGKPTGEFADPDDMGDAHTGRCAWCRDLPDSYDEGGDEDEFEPICAACGSSAIRVYETSRYVYGGVRTEPGARILVDHIEDTVVGSTVECADCGEPLADVDWDYR